ncbi:MAG: NUDIX hydrolase [Pseudonocardiaceae bacterium]
MVELTAAGGLLWRSGSSGTAEVAVVHRPRYDDWSLPKGKAANGEPLAATAVREIGEETGHRAVLGRRLRCTRYRVPDGEKTVHYWSATPTGGNFTPNDEVDELRWVRPQQAGELLSYRHDRELLTDLDGATAIAATVVLVRHAKAGKREEWYGDDTLRPLSTAGLRQAEALRALLPLFGAARVHSVPRTRCRQTVQDLADDLGVDVVDEPLLSEEGYWGDPAAGLRRITDIARSPGGSTIVCSQGEVIPHVVSALLARSGLPDRDVPSRKGSLWVLFFTTGGHRLVAADYYPDPFG